MSYDIDNMLEISFKENDDFLKIRETLTRIGVASRKDRTLYQSCHIPVSYTHLTLPTILLV